MRESEIEIDKVVALLDEDMREKSEKLQQLIEKDGALKITRLLKKML